MNASSTVISGVMIPPPRRYVASRAATVASGGSSSSSSGRLIGLAALRDSLSARSRLGLSPAAGHHEPEVLLGGGWRHLRDHLALVDHQHAIRERADLLHLERDQQHGAALVALLHQAAVDELD